MECAKLLPQTTRSIFLFLPDWVVRRSFATSGRSHATTRCGILLSRINSRTTFTNRSVVENSVWLPRGKTLQPIGSPPTRNTSMPISHLRTIQSRTHRGSQISWSVIRCPMLAVWGSARAGARDRPLAVNGSVHPSYSLALNACVVFTMGWLFSRVKGDACQFAQGEVIPNVAAPQRPRPNG